MNKIKRGMVVAALAVGTLVGSTAVTTATAPAAQAAGVTGTVCMSKNSVNPSWLYVSTLYIPSTAGWVKVYPGQCARARHFVSGWNLYSPWYYRYAAGRWHTMSTTGTLTLRSHNY